MVKAIILDCFGVLYVPVGEDFYQSHIPDYESHRAHLHDLGRQADIGAISQQDFFKEIAKLTGMSIAEVQNMADSGWTRNRALLDYSQSLRPRYKIVMLSNISAGTMNRFFTQAERQDYFDAVVISSEVGLIKPQIEIFEIAAQRLGVRPDACLMVDDSPVNCSAAIEAGMQAIVYQSTEQVKNDLSKML